MKFNLSQKYKQQYLKNWKFWFKLFWGLSIIVVLLSSYIVEMVGLNALKHDLQNHFQNMGHWTSSEIEAYLKQLINSDNRLYSRMNWIAINLKFDQNHGGVLTDYNIGVNFGDFTIHTFSFFTTLSNLAVGLWFLLAAFYPQNEGKKHYLSYGSTLAVVTYITITLVIYNGILLPKAISIKKNMEAIVWIVSTFLHLVAPIVFIVYICYCFELDARYQDENIMKKQWPKLILILLIYAIYIMLRGEMRYRSGKPVNTQYPYFFLAVHERWGWAMFIGSSIVVLVLCLGCSMIYHTILLKKLQKKQEKMVDDIVHNR
ncbi:Pr6Pr family membrane protein [Williamsoniiplasma lucivorax]|uniref:Transmembrane protein n=1 Tax=Williamsoniiplasma lucivorax TaxID=209274 RepID=A0A2S5RCY4_9MOLU|nr:Pr6Pr family membrane protein [Williamsoniiplasma lucivorax]PPE05183.1 hypothetical protein ELUCI_v1c07190 [Williamsoniiplasma lucivorax]